MNPKKFGSLANHKQQQWELPLPEFIEELYKKRIGKIRPDNVRPIEQMVHAKKQKQVERKKQKQGSVQ